MKKLIVLMIVFLLQAGSHAGELQKASSKALADEISGYIVGLCKRMHEKDGTDFTSCYSQGTDVAIATILLNANKPAQLTKAPGSYEATADDVDVKTLLERWAKIDGKELVWQAVGNAGIKDFAGLNAYSKLSQAKTFGDALNRLNGELEYARNDKSREYPPRPLKACIFDNAIVVRAIEQPPCSEKL